MSMRCAAALSTARNADAAFRDVLDRVADGLGDGPADLAMAFVSPHHADDLGRLAAQVRARKLGRHVMGCTGEAIAGPDREVEAAPAVGLWAVRFPEGVTLRPMHL